MRLQKYVQTIVLIWKATRIKRGTYAALSAVVASAFVGTVDLRLFALLILCFVVYAIGGLVNALKDNDFPALTRQDYIWGISILTLFSFLCGLLDYILLLFVLVGLVLGYVYSHHSRYVLYGDIFVGSLYHIFLPMLAVFLLYDLSLVTYLPLVFFLQIVFTFLLSVKNINGYEEDKERGYITFMTLFPTAKGTQFTFFSSLISAVLMFLLPLAIPTNMISLSILLLAVPLFYFLFRSIARLQAKQAVIYSRMAYFLLLFSMVISFNPGLLFMGIFLFFSTEFIVDFVRLVMLKRTVQL